jgi:predicted glutamine amidotransferase
MCRLFGLTAGRQRVHATFWLLDAPDSLLAQSRRNPDGCGIGYFDGTGAPVLDKQPEPGFADPEFTRAAKEATAATFVAHVRWASTGGRTMANTHPFAMAGRIMAHNGGFGELAQLDAQLGAYRELVRGETDSERYFALITQQTDVRGGDLAAGIAAAARWIAARLPVSSLNTVVTTGDELWALRYPGAHALHVLQRPAGTSRPAEPMTAGVGGTGAGAAGAGAAGAGAAGVSGGPGFHARSGTSSYHLPGLRDASCVVVASEALDGEDGWRMLAPGELVHVGPGLAVESAVVIAEPPARPVPLPAGNPNIDS